MISELKYTYWCGTAMYDWVTNSFNGNLWDGISMVAERWVMDDFGTLVQVLGQEG